jgi:transposase-like protein
MPKGRQHTADQKLKILEEARELGTTVAEVLRRHQLDW